MKQNEDRQLVLRMQQGEIAAFDLLYAKYQAAIFSNVFKLLKEVAGLSASIDWRFSQSVIKTSCTISSVAVAGWLFVVSYNKAVTQLKKERTKVLENELDKVAVKNASDDVVNVINEQWEILEKAIESLSPQKEKVFNLCKIQGRTYEQTALQLGISKHTVKEYLSDAITLIKAYVTRHYNLNMFLFPGLLYFFS